MRRVTAGLGSLVIAAGLATTVALDAGAAAPPAGTTQQGQAIPHTDDLPNAAEEKRRELRQVAIQDVLSGRAKVEQRGGSKVVKVGKTGAPAAQAEDQYVELAREKTDKIFVVLAEFGNERAPGYPDQDTNKNIPGPSTWNGPAHNAIPAPDRTKDNSTVWQPNYDKAHYEEVYFGDGELDDSVKSYYERQSSGRYSVEGQVTDWVKVRYNEARYGRSGGYPCGDNVCSNTWALIKDAIDTWVADQHAKGRTDADIKADLQSYDQWDRNDFDHDGNFNEPDGYIDHFQIVHAGGDEADGDPYQGEDAIWSHRWKAFQNTGDGPTGNKDGGTQIGTTGLWVADYTIQPENGGVSVFTHEYGHDLGLPDHYDTAGGPDNAVNWWTLMAQSRVSDTTDQGIGTRAADLGAWDKLQLGWLDYEIVVAGQNRTLDLGPHEYNSAKAQGVVVVLPQKSVAHDIGAPAAGTKQWWSGSDDDYDATLTRSLAIPAGTTTLSFQARWNIEDCGTTPCDYGYVEVDDGTGFKAIPGTITKPAEQNGIDGYQGTYVPATFDLSAYAGKTIQLRLRYKTDGAAQGTNPNAEAGFFADEIKVTNGTTTRLQRRRGSRRERLDGGRLERGRQLVQHAARPVLHRVQPHVRELRQVPADGPVQLRVPEPAGQGRALPVPERPARLLLGHEPEQQQRVPAPGPGLDPADRREPAADLPPRRQAVARPGPDLRRAVRAGEVGLVHAARAGDGRGVVHPRPGRRADLRRPQGVLGPGAPDGRREGPAHRRPDARDQAERHVDDGAHQRRRRYLMAVC